MTTDGKGCSESERRQFERKLLELMPFAKNFARKLAGAEKGEDLLQDGLAKAIECWNQFAPGSNLKAWFFTIIRNLYYTERRRAWRQVPWDQEAAERMPQYRAGEMQGAEAACYFHEALASMRKLSPEQEEALVGAGFLGLTYDELAKSTCAPVGTVKSRVGRARKSLRAIVEI